MGKGKLEKFAEVATFDNVLQPHFDEVFQKDYPLKGRWAPEFFGNDNPLILELGCGKGEYTIGQAEVFPHNNFIGMDIKGSRIWKGARHAVRNNMTNVAFLRTHIDFIESFFAPGEVSEIWITFPDPRKEKPKKRLTSPRFLNRYNRILHPEGIVHLKTDSQLLYHYTLEVIRHNRLNLLAADPDIYAGPLSDERLAIKTFYEKGWLEAGKKITYLSFRPYSLKPLEEPDWTPPDELRYEP